MSRLQYRLNQHATSTPPRPRITAHAAPGDQQRLRLLPAIGPNAPGAIPGTRPDHNTRILNHGRNHGN